MIFSTLKKFMNVNNVNQHNLSKVTGISRTTLMPIINNTNQNIKYDTVEKLCQFFDIGMQDLLIYSKINVSYIESSLIETTGTNEENISYELYVTLAFDDKHLQFFGGLTFDKGLNNLVDYQSYSKTKEHWQLECLVEPSYGEYLKNCELTQGKLDLFTIVFDIRDKVSEQTGLSKSLTKDIKFRVVSRTKNSVDTLLDKISKLSPEEKNTLINEIKK